MTAVAVASRTKAYQFFLPTLNPLMLMFMTETTKKF